MAQPAAMAGVEPEPRTMHLKILSNSEEVGTYNCYNVSLDTTIGWLKTHLRDAIPSHPSTERQRFIYSGRFIDDDNATLANIFGPSATEQQAIHLVLRPDRSHDPTASLDTRITSALPDPTRSPMAPGQRPLPQPDLAPQPAGQRTGFQIQHTIHQQFPGTGPHLQQLQQIQQHLQAQVHHLMGMANNVAGGMMQMPMPGTPQQMQAMPPGMPHPLQQMQAMPRGMPHPMQQMEQMQAMMGIPHPVQQMQAMPPGIQPQFTFQYHAGMPGMPHLHQNQNFAAAPGHGHVHRPNVSGTPPEAPSPNTTPRGPEQQNEPPPSDPEPRVHVETSATVPPLPQSAAPESLTQALPQGPQRPTQTTSLSDPAGENPALLARRTALLQSRNPHHLAPEQFEIMTIQAILIRENLARMQGHVDVYTSDPVRAAGNPDFLPFRVGLADLYLEAQVVELAARRLQAHGLALVRPAGSMTSRTHSGHAPAAAGIQTPPNANVCLLRSPTGEPHALLVGSQGTYRTPNLPAGALESLFPSPAHPNDDFSRAVPALLGAPQPAQQPIPPQQPVAPEHPAGFRAELPRHAAANGQIRPAQAFAAAPPGQALARPLMNANEILAMLRPLGSPLWLAIRIAFVVYFFGGVGMHSNGWLHWRPVLITVLMIVAWAGQQPFMRRRWEALRRHFEQLVGVQWAQVAPAAGIAAPGPAGAGVRDQQAQGPVAAANAVAAPGITVEQVAENMVRRRDARDRSWIYNTAMAVERAATLFLASLWPGMGEGIVRAREDAELRQRIADARRREADLAARVERATQRIEVAERAVEDQLAVVDAHMDRHDRVATTMNAREEISMRLDRAIERVARMRGVSAAARDAAASSGSQAQTGGADGVDMADLRRVNQGRDGAFAENDAGESESHGSTEVAEADQTNMEDLD